MRHILLLSLLAAALFAVVKCDAEVDAEDLGDGIALADSDLAHMKEPTEFEELGDMEASPTKKWRRRFRLRRFRVRVRARRFMRRVSRLGRRLSRGLRRLSRRLKGKFNKLVRGLKRTGRLLTSLAGLRRKRVSKIVKRMQPGYVASWRRIQFLLKRNWHRLPWWLRQHWSYAVRRFGNGRSDAVLEATMRRMVALLPKLEAAVTARGRWRLMGVVQRLLQRMRAGCGSFGSYADNAVPVGQFEMPDDPIPGANVDRIDPAIQDLLMEVAKGRTVGRK